MEWSGDRHIAGVRRVRGAEFWYTEANDDRHPLEIPPEHWGRRAVFAWNAVIALVFAIVTADQRTLFYVVTFLWILLSYATSRYYQWKLKQVRRT
jgi:hypothetical protein